jgi:septal ring factor EnvC (AmiA/AmiB activator)
MALIALLLLPVEGAAQGIDAVKKQLDDAKRKLDEKKRLQDVAAASVADIARQREELNRKLIETAELIQTSEARLTELDNRIGGLEEVERQLRGSLAQRHDQIAQILAVIQRMGRNPPPVMITRREDALKMVRSAMLLAATFPETQKQALQLKKDIDELLRIVGEIKVERDKARAESERLAASQLKLKALMDEKRLTLAEQQEQLERIRREADAIRSEADSLGDLVARLDKVVTAAAPSIVAVVPAPSGATGLVPPTASPPADAPGAGSVAPPAGPPSPSGDPDRPKLAVVQPAPKPAVSDPAVEIAPRGTVASFSPGRIAPAMPFAKALKQLRFPVHGQRVTSFGERVPRGTSQGVYVATRHEARVTSPADGWVVFAGPFKQLGPTLIISGGDGYHIVLLGMSQIDVQAGQFVLMGEPVGTMPAAPKAAAKSQGTNPVLYIEFRKDGRPINPDPWWVDSAKKVQ